VKHLKLENASLFRLLLYNLEKLHELFLMKVDAKRRRSTAPCDCAEEPDGTAAKAIKIAWSLKPLGRGLGGSAARPMMGATIAALLPLRIGRSS
jgi:hypothetical protein